MSVRSLANDYMEGLGVKTWGVDWRQKRARADAELAQTQAQTAGTEAQTKFTGAQTETAGLNQQKIKMEIEQATKDINEQLKNGYISPAAAKFKLEQAGEQARQRLMGAQTEQAHAGALENRAQATEAYARAKSWNSGMRNAAGTIKTDVNGNMVRIRPDNTVEPITNPDGTPMRAAPTAQLANRETQGKILDAKIQEVEALLRDPEVGGGIDPVTGQKVAGGIGPGRGHLNMIKDNAGFANPKIRAYRSGLRALASMMAIVHGYRGGHMTQQDFEKLIGDLEQGREQVGASLHSARNTALMVENAGGLPENPYDAGGHNDTPVDVNADPLDYSGWSGGNAGAGAGAGGWTEVNGVRVRKKQQ